MQPNDPTVILVGSPLDESAPNQPLGELRYGRLSHIQPLAEIFHSSIRAIVDRHQQAQLGKRQGVQFRERFVFKHQGVHDSKKRPSQRRLDGLLTGVGVPLFHGPFQSMEIMGIGLYVLIFRHSV